MSEQPDASEAERRRRAWRDNFIIMLICVGVALLLTVVVLNIPGWVEGRG